MGDYIRTPVLPEKCPKCDGPLNEGLECVKECGYWGHPPRLLDMANRILQVNNLMNESV